MSSKIRFAVQNLLSATETLMVTLSDESDEDFTEELEMLVAAVESLKEKLLSEVVH